MTTCIYCYTPTIPSCIHPHWKYCPRCEPRMVQREKSLIRDRFVWLYGDNLASKGRPHRDGRPA